MKPTLDTILRQEVTAEAGKEVKKVAETLPDRPIPDVPPDATTVETFELFFGPDVAAMPLPIPVVIDATPTRIGHNKNAPMRVTDFPANGAVGDPRPDLPGGAWWDAVLRSLFAMDGHEPTGLYGRFHGLRCVDAVRLAPATKGVRVVALDGEMWGMVRGWIVATMGKAATLDVVLKGVVVVGEGAVR